MNRALRAATMGVLLFSPFALAACCAGQVTQTATQQRDQRGAMAEVGDLTLRAITLAYPRDGVYEAGDDATVRLAIANPGNEDDTLTGVSGEGFNEAVIETSDGGESGDLEIPAGSTVFVGAEDGPTITLTDLDEELTTGEAVELELTFADAGAVTVPAVVTSSEEVLERGEGFDFHHEAEESTGEEAGEDEVAGGAHG